MRKPKGDTEILYTTLGVEKKATQGEIKKAYRVLARKYHPDRPNGDAEKFKAVQNAYDCLGDPEKRKAYDATGDPNADPNMLPNGRRKRKGKPTTFELEVPLEQFYNGATRRIRVTKTVICGGCSGRGGQGVTSCPPCRGRGVRIIDRHIGHNMVQRMQMECDRCGGKGEVIPDGQRCQQCRASGLKKETKVIAVQITRGMRHKEKIVFNEEGDQHPDVTPGDVIVVLKQVAHKTFKRTPDGCHLMVTRQISLLEALTGFQFVVDHLDGRKLLISSDENMVYNDNVTQAIREEGMPVMGGSTHGHLYITLKINMPRALSAQQKQALKQSGLLGATRVLPEVVEAQAQHQRNAEMDTTEDDGDSKEVSQVTLEKVDMEAEKEAYKKLLRETHSQYDSDDEDAHEGQQVGCRTQ